MKPDQGGARGAMDRMLAVRTHLEHLYFEHYLDDDFVFPGELDLARSFRTTRSTVRHAWDLMTEQYALRRVKKRGTVIDRSRPFRKGSSGILGIVMPIGEAMGGLFLSGFFENLRQEQFRIHLEKSHHTATSDRDTVRSLLTGRIDAIALWPTSPPPMDEAAIRLFRNLPVPFVAVDHALEAKTGEAIPTHLVEPDNEGLLRETLRALLERETPRMFVIDHPEPRIRMGNYRTRLETCTRVLGEHGVPFKTLSFPAPGPGALAPLTRRIAQEGPDAFYFLPIPHRLPEILEALERDRVPVPRFLSFHMTLAEFLHPSVQWILHDPMDLGRRTADILLKQLKGPRSPLREHHVIPGRLIPAKARAPGG